MKKIFFLGDMHGRIYDLTEVNKFCQKESIDTVIQVGDFGLGFQDPCPVATLIKTFPQTWYTCLGNHDNWPKFRTYEDKNLIIKDRNTSINMFGYRFLFFGGTESVDSHERIEGKNWWREESPTTNEANRFFDLLNQNIPTIVIAHDAPYFALGQKYLTNHELTQSNVPIQNTTRFMEKLFNNLDHKPRFWFYGHHHNMFAYEKNGTDFFCCGLHGQGWIFNFEEHTLEQIPF
jgi:predicted phosphodiesterase